MTISLEAGAYSEFVNLEGGDTLTIEDLSDPDLASGTMSLELIVDDGEDSTSYQILLVINEPIVIEMEVVEIVEEEEIVEETTADSESTS